MDHNDRPLRVKTCLSSFERYCEDNNRCQTQMSKLRQCLDTTMTRYSKRIPSRTPDKPKDNISASPYKPPSRKGLKYKHLMRSCFDPELMEITKIKLQPTEKYTTKMKT
jgi:hypothetical protein